MRIPIGILALLLLSLTGWRCSRERGDGKTAYTEEDFVTGNYLDYQDSLVHAWNMMMSDDNDKLSALQQLLVELHKVDPAENQNQLSRFENRLDQLHRIRYTQKSMSNNDVIEEYDFASTALVREILSEAELSTGYADNILLQHLVEQIRMAEERIENYRADYDDLVTHYNTFLEVNKTFLGEMGRDSVKKKPRFELVSIE
jgi:hypothetical protein